ncbi:MAG: S46 family peptidase [Bacteroidales bacterium]|nr:S46 family peptidase [Bacteroidales bacterium]
MKRIVIVTALLLGIAPLLLADEGMWLPSLIRGRIADMHAKGFKLTAEDIYSVNQASLKDAVLLFGGGCTGEVVSPEGLVLTNHHCGYYQIARHSSVEHDYLKDGFWAMARGEELPCPGLTVSFLERMEDVTAAVLQGVAGDAPAAWRDSVVLARSGDLVKAACARGAGLTASVEPLYYGNQYFLFVYKVYRDIRLVGAPPSSIGKFGGDTDNWMWPRHTGDFSIFRIYADASNEPADYSVTNVPYVPRRFFKISTAGVREGDFTFIYGNPGSTQEYITGEAVRWIGEVADPERIALRDLRLGIIKSYMARSQELRIRYSSRAATVANAWKKWQGESLGIRRMKTVAAKKAYEVRFAKWASASSYEGVVERIDSLLRLQEPYDFARFYYQEAVSQIELASFAASQVKILSEDPERAEASARSFFGQYSEEMDREMFLALMDRFNECVPEEFKPAYFKEQMDRYGSVAAWADAFFAESVFADPEQAVALKKRDLKTLREDPAFRFASAFSSWYRKEVLPEYQRLSGEIKLLQRDYMRGQMMMGGDRDFYPDANLTLRVAYGHVEGYSPSDGVYYTPVSTLKGVIEKDNPDIFDYDIPQSLRDLYAKSLQEDPAGVGMGTVPVCFLATNHTTGGNSGSPVINADGDLIGINFDRVWEGTMSDIVYDPDYCRNISLDIRYLLFVVRELGHADHLLNEITIVN